MNSSLSPKIRYRSGIVMIGKSNNRHQRASLIGCIICRINRQQIDFLMVTGKSERAVQGAPPSKIRHTPPISASDIT